MKRIMIVEDDPMASQLLEIYIKEHKEYELVCNIESASMAEVYCLSQNIDLILMDVCTAMNASGLDAAEKIKKNFPHIKIVIITSQPECSFIDRARQVGVDSFWYKSSKAEEIITVIEKTFAGENIYPDTTPTLVFGDALSIDLSDRELEVLRELVAGETDADIAEHLFMSVRTVKSHITNMKNKTGFKNRTELAVRARECGLIINDKHQE
ncbi:MAG: response regulator transcription factor [Ruminococcaceae bacterium]|nr:response regulator transcription factor [Oscillospiraceae bacterium]